MYILKNAVVSITRNKGRNILMGIIILVIACSSCITLAIRNAASKLVDSYENKYDIEATITMNRQNMMENFKR
ncbi:MAG: ABC transporter permease, partial [bacterium]|nr:ABC transporter permease [bacterium]